MNPIWRLQHDIRRTRSDNEKRARQQKELQRHRDEKDQRREDAIDRERQRSVAGQDGPNDVFNDEPEKESPAEQFQRELCWCIQQVEQGLTSVKPTSKQAKDAEKLLRTLKSHKAPMVKKRQVMRMTFGDYRKKMEAEKTKHEKRTTQPTLTPVASDHQSMSTFFRHAYRCPLQGQETSVDTSHQMETQTDVNEKKDGEKIVPPQVMEGIESIQEQPSTFMFNFDIDKNLLDSRNDGDNQTSPAKLEENDNTGRRRNKGKKKRRMKGKTNDEKDEEKKSELINKEGKEEVKEVDQTESSEGSGEVERGILNLKMSGDATPFKFNFDVENTGEASI